RPVAQRGAAPAPGAAERRRRPCADPRGVRGLRVLSLTNRTATTAPSVTSVHADTPPPHCQQAGDRLDGVRSAPARRPSGPGYRARPGRARADRSPRGDLMPVPHDPAPALQDYAHPEKLVTTEWLAEHLGAVGSGDLAVVESDEDVLLYETGHIPGAVKIDWHLDLNDPVSRDYVDAEGFAKLMDASGISRDTTVVIYGDKSNWWAAYALWVFELFGHPDVRLLDGGRAAWEAEGREMTTDVATVAEVPSGSGYPVTERIRMPDYPQEGTVRGGHIPTAHSVPWARAAAEDGRFRSRAELEAIYPGELGFDPAQPVIAYCRIGERSAHTWFALKYLLGFE